MTGKLPSEHDSIGRWAEAIAAPSIAPAGGAAAAAGAALAAALIEMVASLTAGRPKYASARQAAEAAAERGAALRRELLALAVEDGKVLAEFEGALALPRTTDTDRSARERAKRDALRAGARIQLEVLERAAEIGELSTFLAGAGVAGALGDAATAGFVAAAAARSAYWAVRANLAGDDDGETGALLSRALELRERTEAAERRVGQLLDQRVR